MLIVGTKKDAILEHLPHTFLLIDDGELIDAYNRPARKAVLDFDVSEHSFNPLKGMNYSRATNFVEVLKAVFPEGENTLTKATFEYQLLAALTSKPTRLATLIRDTNETQYSYQKIQRLLISPILENVLTRPTNISFKGTILARLNRAELGDFDCYVLANLLISQYRGPVIVPDFGFYAHKGHASLIRQDRLIAGINTFDEVPELKSTLLLIEKKIASHCTAADAEILAQYEGLLPGTNKYNDFIAKSIGG